MSFYNRLKSPQIRAFDMLTKREKELVRMVNEGFTLSQCIESGNIKNLITGKPVTSKHCIHLIAKRICKKQEKYGPQNGGI